MGSVDRCPENDRPCTVHTLENMVLFVISYSAITDTSANTWNFKDCQSSAGRIHDLLTATLHPKENNVPFGCNVFSGSVATRLRWGGNYACL